MLMRLDAESASTTHIASAMNSVVPRFFAVAVERGGIGFFIGDGALSY